MKKKCSIVFCTVVLCSVSIRPLFSQNPRDTLYLESIALSFHKAAGAVIQALLVEDGVNVKASSAPHALAYEHLATGKVDFVCAAWLPGSHGKYLDSIAKVGQVIEKFSVIYNPYTIWGVPDYIPANEVASVGDLKKPNVAAKMNKLIQGIGAGAGISRFSREIVEKYKLGEWGYHFENGSMEDCVNAFERAYAKKEWVVVPLWHPQYLHSKYKIRELKEPNGLLRGKDKATLVMRQDAMSKLPQKSFVWLKKIFLGNDVVAQLDYEVSINKKTPLYAAEEWLKKNQHIVKKWRE